MIVITPEGETREMPWSQASVVGYRMATVILRASDTRAMLRMMRDRPEEFYVCMAQFNARFVENRAPNFGIGT